MEYKTENLATKEDCANAFKSLKRLILAIFIVLFLMIFGLYFCI